MRTPGGQDWLRQEADALLAPPLAEQGLSLELIRLEGALPLEMECALRLRDAGTIKSFEQLNEAALAQHPGARIEETELEDEYGRYIYQIELRDTQGVQWDLELDASTGEILKNHQDD